MYNEFAPPTERHPDTGQDVATTRDRELTFEEHVIAVAEMAEAKAAFSCETHKANCRQKHLGSPILGHSNPARLLSYAAHVYSKYVERD